MKRGDLEHIIRAISAITNQYEFVIIGSQSILGECPNAPEVLLKSIEADVYPLQYDARLSDLIDGSIGEDSPFQDMFGYYAQGVGPETATLPSGWKDRLIKIQNEATGFSIGYCIEPHDLAASKLFAGRDKDWVFVEAMLKFGIISGATLQARVASLPIQIGRQEYLRQWVVNRMPQETNTQPKDCEESRRSLDQLE